MEVQETEKELKMLRASINKLETAIYELNRKLDDISGKVNVLTRDDVDVMISFMRLIAANQLMMDLTDFAISSESQIEEALHQKANSGLDSLRAAYADKQVGERFEFGSYPQGANGEVKPITWRVLRRDIDSLLVISEYGLDAKPYNEEFKNITWSECTLRSWLNCEFMQKAFTAQERSLIKVSSLSNNAGLSTDDSVFLLSIDEAKSLFGNNNDRKTKPSAYAIKNGAWIANSSAYRGNAWWWLRSRYFLDYDAALVDADGSVDYDDVDLASGSVRPAFRIAI